MREIIKDLADLEKFAGRLAAKLAGGEVVALSGQLGAGKTALTQMLARRLGVRENLASPTFVLCKNYAARKNLQAIKNFCHVDLFRLSGGGAAEKIGFEERCGQKDCLVVIEWAEKIKKRLPPGTRFIKIKVNGKGQRVITY